MTKTDARTEDVYHALVQASSMSHREGGWATVAEVREWDFKMSNEPELQGSDEGYLLNKLVNEGRAEKKTWAPHYRLVRGMKVTYFYRPTGAPAGGGSNAATDFLYNEPGGRSPGDNWGKPDYGKDEGDGPRSEPKTGEDVTFVPPIMPPIVIPPPPVAPVVESVIRTVMS